MPKTELNQLVILFGNEGGKKPVNQGPEPKSPLPDIIPPGNGKHVNIGPEPKELFVTKTRYQKEVAEIIDKTRYQFTLYITYIGVCTHTPPYMFEIEKAATTTPNSTKGV